MVLVDDQFYELSFAIHVDSLTLACFVSRLVIGGEAHVAQAREFGVAAGDVLSAFHGADEELHPLRCRDRLVISLRRGSVPGDGNVRIILCELGGMKLQTSRTFSYAQR